jgi:hypothetical protein
MIGALSACAGGASTDEPSANTSNSDVSEPDRDGSAPIVIDALGEIPPECQELLAGFLQDIEPAVSAVDWDTATLADMQDVSPVIDQTTIRFDTAMEAAGCDDFVFGADDDQQFEFALEIARQEAPGSLRWLQFSRDLYAGLETTEGGLADDASALEADCDEATAGVIDAIGGATDVDNIPLTDLVEINNGLAVVEAVCTPDEAAALLEDPTLQAFFGAG